MAKRGRPPKTTAEKIATDNPGNRALNLNEPVPTSGALPPRDLSKMAGLVWNRAVLGQAEGLFTICDEETLAAYCEAAAMRHRLQAELADEPLMVKGSTGQPTINPLVKAIADQSRLLVTLGAELGFSPRARQGLEIKPDDGKKQGRFSGLVGGTRSESVKVQ